MNFKKKKQKRWSNFFDFIYLIAKHAFTELITHFHIRNVKQTIRIALLVFVSIIFPILNRFENSLRISIIQYQTNHSKITELLFEFHSKRWIKCTILSHQNISPIWKLNNFLCEENRAIFIRFGFMRRSFYFQLNNCWNKLFWPIGNKWESVSIMKVNTQNTTMK